MSPVARRWALLGALVFGVVGAQQVIAPATGWEHLAGGIGLVFCTWILLRTGPANAAREITFPERRMAEFLATCGFIPSGMMLVGLW